jgi:TP901 family phage tail tape measure protein
VFNRGAVTVKFKTDIKDLASGLRRARQSVGDFARSTSDTFGRTTNRLKEIGKVDKVFDQLKRSASQSLRGIENVAEKTFKKIGNSVRNFATSSISNIANVGKNMAMIGTGVAIGGFLNAIRVAGDFQTQMLKVKAISRATAEEFANLSNQAKDLGRTTQFSASQVGQAQQFQAMAGLEVNEIMSATPGILNLAAAANLDLGRSADIATNIMSQFGLEAKDMDKIVDTLALTVNTSNQNMEQLADAMNYLGPTAKAMGISLEEASAVTGVMASNGLQGSLGTRALGTSMTRLAKPTDAMEQAISRLNLQLFDQKGNFVGITNTVAQLNKGMGGMTQQQKQFYLSTLFGSEAIQEWNILLATGSDELASYTDKLLASGGAAGAMAETMQSGWKGAIDRMKSAWEGLMISIGETGILDLATEGIELLANSLGKMGDKVESVVKPKMQSFLEELRVWFNSGGKDAIMGFLSTAWAGLTSAFQVLTERIWPRLEPYFTRFADYMNSPQFKEDLVKVADLIGTIADKMVILAEYLLDVVDYYKQFNDQVKQTVAPADNFVNARRANFSGLSAIFGNRANGGPVEAGKMYQVNEYQRPEMFEDSRGRQYMMPTTDGKVINQNQMRNEQSTTVSKNITINQYGANLDPVFTSAPFLAV